MLTLDQQIHAASVAAEIVRDFHEIPAGELYSILMAATGMTISEFELMVAVLQEAKLISYDRKHLITWVGPALTMN